MVAALPHLSWDVIRKKIAQADGKGVKVPEMGFLAPSDTILHYLETHPETATMMPFAILENWLRQIPQNEKLHHLRRFNLAILNPNAILLSMPACETNRPRDSPTPSRNPKTISNSSELPKEEDHHEAS